jgi:hypothetical protein
VSLEDGAVLTTPLLPDLRRPLEQIFELPSVNRHIGSSALGP